MRDDGLGISAHAHAGRFELLLLVDLAAGAQRLDLRDERAAALRGTAHEVRDLVAVLEIVGQQGDERNLL